MVDQQNNMTPHEMLSICDWQFSLKHFCLMVEKAPLQF